MMLGFFLILAVVVLAIGFNWALRNTPCTWQGA